MQRIKKQLEENEGFQFWNNEIGLSFDDFTLVNVETNEILKEGKKDIGKYFIYVDQTGIKSVCYDFDNETVRKHNLKRISVSA